MSLLDSIKHAGSNVAHFGGEVVSDAKKIGSKVVDDAEKAGSTVVSVVHGAEHAAVRSLQFEARVIRFGLEKSFDGAKKVGSTVVHGAETIGTTAVKLSVKGFNSITHPGDPNPPAAQGLKFSETKSAAGLAYDAKKGEVYQFPDGKQWQVVDVKDDAATGFRAIALKPTDPNDKRVIVSYAGTRDGKDWKANIGQGFGLSTKQYKEAVQFANKWKAAAGNNVILTGHSLGGGLASYASIKTGLHATAVNSAPLALNHLGLNPLAARRITQYYVPGEALSVLNKANNLDVRPGNQIAVRGKDSILDPRSVGTNHGLDHVAPGIPAPIKIR